MSAKLGAFLQGPLEFVGFVQEGEVEGYFVPGFRFALGAGFDPTCNVIFAYGEQSDYVLKSLPVEEGYAVARLHTQDTGNLMGYLALYVRVVGVNGCREDEEAMHGGPTTYCLLLTGEIKGQSSDDLLLLATTFCLFRGFAAPVELSTGYIEEEAEEDKGHYYDTD